MVEAAISGSALIVLLLIIRALFRTHLTNRFRAALWAVALVRLLLPFSLAPSPISLMNALPSAAENPRPYIAQPAQDYSLPSAPVHTPEAENGTPAAVTPAGESVAPPAGESTGSPAVEATNSPAAAVTREDPVTGSDPEAAASSAAVSGGAAEEPSVSGEAAVSADTRVSAPPAAEEESAARRPDTRTLLTALYTAGCVIAGCYFVFINVSCARSLRRRRKFLFRHGSLAVYEAEGLRSPCIFGLPHPAIYVTPEVAADEKALRHVLAHESAHYRRGDHVWALLRALCLVLYWWDPIVYIGAAVSKADCELACDEIAIKRLGEAERYSYGLTLVGLVSPKRRAGDLLSAATTMTGSRRNIRERVEMIVKKPKNAAISLVAVLLIVTLTAACAFTGAETNSGFTPGIYVLDGSGSGVPQLVLKDDGSFELDLGLGEDYIATGEYTVDGSAVSLLGSGGTNYSLEFREGALVFLSAASDTMRYYPQPRSSRTVDDGATFSLLASLELTSECAGDYYADITGGDRNLAAFCPVLSLDEYGRFSLSRGALLPEPIEGSYTSSADGALTLVSNSGESFTFGAEGGGLVFDAGESARDLFLRGALEFERAEGSGGATVSVRYDNEIMCGFFEMPENVYGSLAGKYGWTDIAASRLLYKYDAYNDGGLSVYMANDSLSAVYVSYTKGNNVEIPLRGDYEIYSASGSAIDEDNAAIAVFRVTDHDFLTDIYFTDDGGLTWESAPRQPPSTYVGSASLYGNVIAGFASTDVGYVCIQNADGYFPALYLTFNGGRSWIEPENVPHAILIEDADSMSFTGIEGLTEAGYLSLYATSARGEEIWESVYTFNTEGRCCAMSSPVPVLVELMDGEEHTAYLDWDGVRDTVSYSAADSVGQLIINGTDYSDALTEYGGSMLPYAKIVDMDTEDGLLEIALGYKDEYGSEYTVLARYDDGALSFITGTMPGVEPLRYEEIGPDSLTFYIHGGGAIGTEPLDLLNGSWKHSQHYELVDFDSDTVIVPSYQELFLISDDGYRGAGPVATLADLPAYSLPVTESEQTTLPAGTDLIFYSTDNKSWASAIAPDGEMYWFQFSDFRHIEDASGNSLYIRDAFSGLEN